MHGRSAATRPKGGGYTHIHTAIDAYSRLKYSEFAGAENNANCVAFLARAIAWFSGHGITTERILTDNGAELGGTLRPTDVFASPCYGVS